MGKERVSTLGNYFQGVDKLLRRMGILTSLEISDRRVTTETLNKIVKEGEVYEVDERNIRKTRKN